VFALYWLYHWICVNVTALSFNIIVVLLIQVFLVMFYMVICRDTQTFSCILSKMIANWKSDISHDMDFVESKEGL
jgi:type IV secretory pathway VirB3-like protein